MSIEHIHNKIRPFYQTVWLFNETMDLDFIRDPFFKLMTQTVS